MTKNLRNSPLDAERITKAKYNALCLALDQSESRVVEFRALALVDLQGIYLRLHEVLSDINFPIESGVVIGKFAALQINEVFSEIPKIIQRKYGKNVRTLQSLIDNIEIKTVNGKAYLAERLDVLKNGIYVDVKPSFEVFYALPPLADIEWKLKQEARKGSRAAKSQLDEIKTGVLRTKLFRRNYKYYDSFVEVVKGNINCHGSEQGFFTYGVDASGLERFDEKEVDTRVTIRAMEVLFEKQAEALCIISSDQDFIPIKGRCDKFGVEFFQADAAKFMSGPGVGRKISDLSENFIRGTLKPEWPLEILSEFIKFQDKIDGRTGIGEKEARALASFHNMLNEFKVGVVVAEDNSMELKMSRPLESDIETRIDGRTKMKQVRVTTLEY